MSLTSKILAKVVASQTGALDLGDRSYPLAASRAVELADGTGAGQADLVFSDQRTLAASATESLDLAGSLTDAFGTSLTFARVKGLYIAAAAANTNNLLIGGAASNQFATFLGDASDVIVVRPGGMLLLAASDATAYVVTAATGDLLKIANSGAGTPVTYDIVIIGASA